MDKFRKLIEVEEKFDLRTLVINDIWIYPIIKQNIFVYDISENKSSLGRTNKNSIYNKFFQSFKWNSRNSLLSKIDLLIIDSAASRREMEDEKYYSIHTDFIYDILPEKNILTFERPSESLNNHYEKIPNINIYYPDMDILKIFLKSSILKQNYNLSQNKLLLEILSFLDVNNNIIKFIETKLDRFFQLVKFYDAFLKKTKPKIITLINAYNYSYMAVIYSAKKLNIPTVELQHGFIRSTHPGYMYKQIVNRDLFPDSVFTYGDYFTDFLTKKSKLFEIGKAKTCGSVFLENQLKASNNLQSLNIDLTKKIIYVTSQWSARERLKAFSLQLSKTINDEYLIVYKTHPGETEVEEFYKEFRSQKNIWLIQDVKVNSTDLMKNAYVHSTVYSTSFMEAHFLQKPNILIYDERFSYEVEEFIDDKTIYLAKTPLEFADILFRIQKNKTEIDNEFSKSSDKFYKQNASENLKSELQKYF